MNALDIELAVARFYDTRRNVIVPNVYRGLGLYHECDLLVVSAAGYAREIEIKVSKSDIKRDLKKKHGHQSNLIKELVFAVPAELVDCEYIPDRAGIISVRECDGSYYATHMRRGEINRDARKLTDAEIKKLLYLGYVRMWTLKNKINRLNKWRGEK